jgi:hypothetical protein
MEQVVTFDPGKPYHDPRDEAFVQLLEAARQFNRRPSILRRETVVAAARLLVDAYDLGAGVSR